MRTYRITCCVCATVIQLENPPADVPVQITMMDEHGWNYGNGQYFCDQCSPSGGTMVINGWS